MSPTPTFQDVEAFVRDFAAQRPRVITPDSRLEADFGVTGDDGDELFEKIADHFGVQLADLWDGIRTTLGLAENQYLFHSEGLDLLGFSGMIRRLRGQPEPLYRDITIGELHNAILRCTPKL